MPETISEATPTIAIITALPKEHAAVSRLLHGSEPLVIRGDPTLYRRGTIPGALGEHEVILACLTKYGNNTASITATNIHRSFPSICDVILVGISAGVPRPKNPSAHVRLGDILVSSGNGVVQFDMGAKKPGEFEHRGTAPPPSARLLQAVNVLESAMIVEPDIWKESFDAFLNQASVNRPRREPHRPFKHPIDRARKVGVPRIFRGAIGASNSLLKDAGERDRVARLHGLLGFEMEGSGVADATWDGGLQYLVIRGVCDYADQNKDDSWQEYASHVAAAYTQVLLLTLPGDVATASSERFSSIPSIEPEQNVRTRLVDLGNERTGDSRRDRHFVASPLEDPESPSRLAPIPVTTQRLTSIAWPSEDFLVCGGFDGRLYWVDPWTSASTSRRLTMSKIRAIEPFGESRLLVADDGGSIWLASGQHEQPVELCRAGSAVYSLASIPGSLKFYSGNRLGVVELWECRGLDTEPRAVSIREIGRHKGPVFGLYAVGDRCLSVGADGDIREFRIGSAETPVRNLSSSAIFCLDWSFDIDLIVAGDASGSLHVIDRGQVQRVNLHRDALRSVAVDFPWVLTYSKDGTAKAYNCRTGFTCIPWEGNDYGYGVRLSPDKSVAAFVNGGGEVVPIFFKPSLGSMTGESFESI